MGSDAEVRTVVGNELDRVAMAQPPQHLKRKSPYKSNVGPRHALDEKLKLGRRDVRLDLGDHEETLNNLVRYQSKRRIEVRMAVAQRFCFVVGVGAGGFGGP